MSATTREQIAQVISNAADSGSSLGWRNQCLHLADALLAAFVVAPRSSESGDANG